MKDRILESFLVKQKKAAAEISAASALVSVFPCRPDEATPQKFIADFRCKGLIQRGDGKIVEHDRFIVGIFFPDHYLSSAPSSFESLTILEPQSLYHPNVRGPYCCAGDAFFRRSPSLLEVTFRLFEIISWNRVTARDPLNTSAAAWARRNADRVPVDRRPLKGKPIDVQILRAPSATEVNHASR